MRRKTWADFWNVEKFPGRRSLRKNPIDSLEQALMADGVSIDQLYPLDVDRAFKSLDKIKQHVDVWWTGGAQSTQLLQSGEVDLISGWNARLQSAIDGGAPATIVWDQGLYSIEGWAIPKGCPRADAAKQFIKFCSTAGPSGRLHGHPGLWADQSRSLQEHCAGAGESAADIAREPQEDARGERELVEREPCRGDRAVQQLAPDLTACAAASIRSARKAAAQFGKNNLASIDRIRLSLW